jgi:hypothetical protein
LMSKLEEIWLKSSTARSSLFASENSSGGEWFAIERKEKTLEATA